ncbi:hypothetical protein WMZ97_20970 [Lentibacillus sp. N15]|uniref:hypothetical protein n=1 Tax=Lentibacillus songyuanensis TaxID=3136161 RepID=UPI0031BA1BD4
MRTKLLMILFLLFIMLTSYIYFGQERSIQTITYFPIDAESSFTNATTDIAMTAVHDHKSYDIDWTSQSKSDKQVYLRQDASLLFANGRLKGVASKWKENAAKIKLSKQFTSKDSSYYQAISFHQGEIHTKEPIKSVQQMSHHELYVVHSPTKPIQSFSEPTNKFETDWQEVLATKTKQQLIYHWNQLMQHFQVNSSSYYSIPLTSLYRYTQTSLPEMSQAKTDQIMGQLWEGLYKNYIVPAASGTNQLDSSYIPLVLIAKDQSHLLVLYQLDGKMQKLIQQL